MEEFAVLYRENCNGYISYVSSPLGYTDKVAILDTDSWVCRWESYKSWYGCHELLSSFWYMTEYHDVNVGYEFVTKEELRLVLGDWAFSLYWKNSGAGNSLFLGDSVVLSNVESSWRLVFLCSSIAGVYRLCLYFRDWLDGSGYLNVWLDVDARNVLCCSYGVIAEKGRLPYYSNSDKGKYEKLLGALAKEMLFDSGRLY